MYSRFSENTKTKIMVRDRYTCVYCGGLAQDVDHVVPTSKGGPAIMGNGVACCHSCNMKKRDKLSQLFITRGLLHLSIVGEDTNWVDTLHNDSLLHAPETKKKLTKIRLSPCTEEKKQALLHKLRRATEQSDISTVIKIADRLAKLEKEPE